MSWSMPSPACVAGASASPPPSSRRLNAMEPKAASGGRPTSTIPVIPDGPDPSFSRGGSHSNPHGCNIHRFGKGTRLPVPARPSRDVGDLQEMRAARHGGRVKSAHPAAGCSPRAGDGDATFRASAPTGVEGQSEHRQSGFPGNVPLSVDGDGAAAGGDGVGVEKDAGKEERGIEASLRDKPSLI